MKFKDLMKDMGRVALDSVKSGVMQGISKSIYQYNKLNQTNTSDEDILTYKIDTKELSSIGLSKTTIKQATTANKTLDKILQKNSGTSNTNLKIQVKPDSDSVSEKFVNTNYEDNFFGSPFKLPNWGYADFVNERAIWQKGLSTALRDPAWCYFKIFFNFDTQYGLFGGLLNNKNPASATNSAARYIALNSSKDMQSKERVYALEKFANLLSFINSNAPWTFKSINNLNEAEKPVLKDFSKDREIEIKCNPDAIDLRLTTLFDLYKFVAYDVINGREILPDNLRKFDMTVVIFESPLKYYHSGMYGKSQVIRYKSANNMQKDGYENMMSCKIYTFINCEFDIDSLSSLTPGEVSNETPFQIGNGSIKIKYGRCYTHTMNEFFGMMFGTDGFYYSIDNELYGTQNRKETLQDKRYELISELELLNNNTKTNKNINSYDYKNLVETSEAICKLNLINAGGNVLGNIYGEDTVIRKDFDDYENTESDTLDGHYSPIQHDLKNNDLTDLTQYKLKKLKNPVDFLKESGASLLAKWLHTGYTYNLGNIYDHDPYTRQSTRGASNQSDGGMYNMGITGQFFNRVNSDYLNDKLATLHGNPDKYKNTEYDRFEKKKIIDVNGQNVIINDGDKLFGT